MFWLPQRLKQTLAYCRHTINAPFMKEGSAQNRGRVKEETQRCYSRIPSHSACPGFVSRSHLQAPATAHGPPPGTRAQRVCVCRGGAPGLGHARAARTHITQTHTITFTPPRALPTPWATSPWQMSSSHSHTPTLAHASLTCAHLHAPARSPFWDQCASSHAGRHIHPLRTPPLTPSHAPSTRATL
jgi:hypothetical protein